MEFDNKGFNKEEIEGLKERLRNSGKNYLLADSEDNSEEYKTFYFIGSYEGQECIYDAALFTLRLHHASELYERAEHEAAKRFPKFRKIEYREDENGDLAALDSLEEEIGLFITEMMMEMEEEESIKVQEFIEIDPHIDYGIGLDASLNVEEVTDKVISKFVEDYKADSLKLDTTLYSFQTEYDEEMS
ncbi:hypothetical protein AB9P05_20755 [Roseivirga sp. BDSF3-8]|uniref:hypothetical protein n=1 Tax=Roseivirga sp. BDSF3-8 TaxID=3241598 RepID=UPI0035322FC7